MVLYWRSSLAVLPWPRDHPLILFIRRCLTDDRWLIARRVLLVLIWLTLAILTHIPVPHAIHEMGSWDKVAHLIAYLSLGFFLTIGRVPGLRHGGVCLLVLALYGVLDEVLQMPVGRTASRYDWIADVIGATLGIAIAKQLMKASSVP